MRAPRSNPLLKSFGEKDCGDRICSVETHFLPTCTIYVSDSDSRICDFPCSKTNCLAETHHWVQCPVWNCVEKTTTTSSPPTSTTTEPDGPSHGQCSSPVCISSVTFNVLIFLVAVVSISVYKVWKRKRTSESQQTAMENPLFDSFQGSNPIIRSRSETLPLLPTSERSVRFFRPEGETSFQRSSPQARIQSFATASPSSVSTSLNPSAPDLPYVAINF